MTVKNTSFPLVSVIMALFNEEKYVKTAIESILNQTYQNFEVIIVDDYSTDKSVQICKSFKDPRIRIYTKTCEPRHPACSRNIAIGIARGKYVVIHDADDYSDPRRFEKQLDKVLEDPGRRVVGCSIKRVVNGNEQIIVLPETHEKICDGFERLFNRATIIAGTIMASREIMQAFRYRPRFKWIHDWDLLLRMYESGKIEFYNCPEPLYTYYIRSKGVVFKPEWLDYNIYVRNSQVRRKKGLEEFQTLEKFLEYIRKHPIAGLKWHGLKKLIELRLRIRQNR